VLNLRVHDDPCFPGGHSGSPSVLREADRGFLLGSASGYIWPHAPLLVNRLGAVAPLSR
jgi:hypothetical protein